MELKPFHMEKFINIERAKFNMLCPFFCVGLGSRPGVIGWNLNGGLIRKAR